MNAFKLVFLFHLKENIRSKMFIVMSLVFFVLVLGFFAYSHFSSQNNQDKVSIVNDSGYSLPIKSLNHEAKTVHFTETSSSIASLKKNVLDGKIDGYIALSNQKDSLIPTIIYSFKRIPNYETESMIQAVIQAEYQQIAGQKLQVSPAASHVLLAHVSVEEKALKSSESTGLVYFFVLLMYMFILSCGQVVAMSISGEKASRVMEIMITKVKPITMMYAKIFASMATGIGNILVIFFSYMIARIIGWTSEHSLTLFGMPLDLSFLNLHLFLFLILYFMLGYVLYAFLFASLSSMVSRLEDLGSIIAPISLLTMAAFMIGMRSLIKPNDSIVLASSYIPFFSPVVSFSRIVLGEAGTLEIILSILILIVSIFVISLIATKIYQRGVMRYSGKTTFKDILHMLKK